METMIKNAVTLHTNEGLLNKTVSLRFLVARSRLWVLWAVPRYRCGWQYKFEMGYCLKIVSILSKMSLNAVYYITVFQCYCVPWLCCLCMNTYEI